MVNLLAIVMLLSGLLAVLIAARQEDDSFVPSHILFWYAFFAIIGAIRVLVNITTGV